VIPPVSLLDFSALAAHLGSGGAGLFPTDTVPALAARPEAAHQLWTWKRRPGHKPLILMGADLAQLLEALTTPWRPAWLEQAERFWPGQVTLVLPIEGPITQALHPGGTSIGLRVPDCPMALELLRRSGPVATTSANRSGEPAALDAQQAHDRFPELPLLGPLPWPAASGIASTVMAWTASGEWDLLRRGAG
jgi:L-threonylcarbamoyladenylate synthase